MDEPRGCHTEVRSEGELSYDILYIHKILNDCKKLTELTDIEKELMVGGLTTGERDSLGDRMDTHGYILNG